MRPTKFPPVEIEYLCLRAIANGENMAKVISNHYHIDSSMAHTVIARIRRQGYDIPKLVHTDQTEWEDKRAQLVAMRKRLLAEDDAA